MQFVLVHICVSKGVYLMVTHILGKSKLEKWHDLGFHGVQGFPKVVGEFVVKFFDEEPCLCICEFGGIFFSESVVLCCDVSL